MGHSEDSKRLKSGVEKVLRSGKVRTRDLGGYATTRDFTTAVCKAVKWVYNRNKRIYRFGETKRKRIKKKQKNKILGHFVFAVDITRVMLFSYSAIWFIYILWTVL